MLRTTLIAAVLLATVPAFGQAPAAPAAPSVDISPEVRRLYADGADAAERGEWERARGLFQQAFDLKPIPKIAANLGRAELMVGKPCAAAEHLEYYLAKEKGADAESLQDVQKVLDKATAKIGVLRVRVNVDGAKVFVDGKSASTSPLTHSIFVEPGNYSVEAQAEGHEPAKKDVAVGANAKLEVPLELTPIKKVRERPPPPAREPAWRMPGILGGIGLAAMGVGVGIGFSVAAFQKNDEMWAEADRLQLITPQNQTICAGLSDPRCANLVDAGQTRDVYGNAAIAGYLVGGIATMGTVVFWHFSKPETAKKRPVTTMNVVPTPGGLSVIGTF